jgi:CRP-like cAMP-binding protein
VGARTSDTIGDRWYQPTAKDWVQVLAAVPFFERLTKRQLRRIAGITKITDYERDEVVVQAGEQGDAFYVILSGQAKVVGRPRARILRQGDHFGEMALIDGEPRSATVVAGGDFQAMVLPRRPFLRLLEREPRIALALMVELSARIRRLEKPPGV